MPEPIEPAGHSTEERHAIADQPTEMFDVEEEFASTEAPAPPDEDLVAEEITEARLAPAAPIAEPEDEEDDDFFDEQRLSDELDQALEAPIEAEPEPEQEDEAEPEPGPPRTRATSRRPPRARARATRTTTPSRTLPTSSRRPRRTTSSGSSRSPRRTSTSTTSPGRSAPPDGETDRA